MDENSTRNTIVLLLKKSGGMSVDELSKMINITPMGIRQHLLGLEKKGLVTYVPKRRGIGRPGFIYMLTPAADELFPKSYDEFALGLLRDIRDREGSGKIEQIFEWRRDRLLKNYGGIIAGKEGLDERLQSFKGALEEEGHLVELAKNGTKYRLTQYHCPISKIASEFKEACSHELRLYRDLLGKDVTREQSIGGGAHSCVYLIPGN